MTVAIRGIEVNDEIDLFSHWLYKITVLFNKVNNGIPHFVFRKKNDKKFIG